VHRVRVRVRGQVEEWAKTRGRPLGLEFDAEGHLIVADGLKGWCTSPRVCVCVRT
jgi:hypothetical protein